RLQAFHAVVHLAERAQDQHGRGVLRRAQGADQRETVDAGQHAVDDERVVRFGGGEKQAVLAVVRVVYVVTRLRETVANERGDVLVVLDDEYPHVPILLPRASGTVRSGARSVRSLRAPLIVTMLGRGLWLLPASAYRCCR